MEAAELARQGLEQELQKCQERLRAVQVERNLLLVSLPASVHAMAALPGTTFIFRTLGVFILRHHDMLLSVCL